ncbi:MAG: ImmA/IrrE family metallo-endopeptidase [Coprobacillus sp.]|nr:ImmA/IrrE family metallo-endopeptidase [Coprobacillus sp.]
MCDKLRSLQALKGQNHEDTALNIFLATNRFEAPIDIEGILMTYGIPISSKDFSESEAKLLKEGIPEKIQGQVHVEGDNIDIYYNPNNSLEIGTKEERKRFTLAHELAHCILHADLVMAENGYIDYYRIDGVDNAQEKEANALAGSILMPKDVISELYEACRKEEKSTLETIESLSAFFDVSKRVVKARIDYLNL